MNSLPNGNTIAAFIKGEHLKDSYAPLRYADSAGSFTDSGLSGLFGDALPIVLDANVLRNNIAYMCRSGQRPILLTGANTGAFRLFCAAHVLSEVNEHSERWASEQGLKRSDYRRCWNEEFLPLLRLVETAGFRVLLSPSEQRRVDLLADRDDVPSVILALALQAFFLSEDAAPHFAVYGEEKTGDERRAWLDVLRSGGDAGHLHTMLSSVFLGPALAATGLANVARSLRIAPPLALCLALAVGMAFAISVSPTDYARIAAGVGNSLKVIGSEVATPYFQSRQRVRAMLPLMDSWDQLRLVMSRDALLTRACLVMLAKSRPGPMSVQSLGDRLPDLGVAQSVQRIGRMLHGSPCFVEPYRGYWQVGIAIVRK